MLRHEGCGLTVVCRKCTHEKFLAPKSMRLLGSRLTDTVRLEETNGFQCLGCRYDRVRLIPEELYAYA